MVTVLETGGGQPTHETSHLLARDLGGTRQAPGRLHKELN